MKVQVYRLLVDDTTGNGTIPEGSEEVSTLFFDNRLQTTELTVFVVGHSRASLHTSYPFPPKNLRVQVIAQFSRTHHLGW